MEDITILVTGASSGIGRGVAAHFCNKGATVFALARRVSKLEELKKSVDHPEKLHVVDFDLGNVEEMNNLMKVFSDKNAKFNFVVQNAGTIGTITPFGKIDPKDWKSTFDTNIHGSLFLLQALFNFKMLEKECRVLHMGTRAAHNQFASWGAYGCSKAAFDAMFRYINVESNTHKLDISVASLLPGLVESDIQQTIRDAKPAEFPLASLFKSLENNKLKDMAEGSGYNPMPTSIDDPSNTARLVDYILTGTSTEEFKKEWDIFDKSHHDKWIK